MKCYENQLHAPLENRSILWCCIFILNGMTNANNYDMRYMRLGLVTWCPARVFLAMRRVCLENCRSICPLEFRTNLPKIMKLKFWNRCLSASPTVPWGLLSWQCACLSFRSNLSHFKRSCLGNVLDAYFLNIFVLHTF